VKPLDSGEPRIGSGAGAGIQVMRYSPSSRYLLRRYKRTIVLVMGISFEARHYYLVTYETAPHPCRSWWHHQIKVTLVSVVLCAFYGAP